MREPAGSRLPGLDAFRGLLAMAVAAYHLSVWWGVWPTGSLWNMAFARLGNYGVSAFFLLSGFLLVRQSPWGSISREGLGHYALRRWLRLAPLFYLAVLLNLSFRLGMGPEASPRMIAENFALIFGAIHPNHALVVGGWYVGLVALAFAAWPVLAWLRSRLGWGFTLALATGLVLWSLPWTLHKVPGAESWNRFHTYVQPGNQLLLLGLGALLAELHGRVPWRLSLWATATLTLPLILWLVWPEPRFYDHFDVLTGWIRYRYLLAVSGILVLAALHGDRPGPFGRALASLGAWSYGIYLLHPFGYRLLVWLGLGKGNPWIPFLLSMALALVFGALAHRYLEQPLGRLGINKPA
jgi:exopolysaccharide production protein ExoZ